MKKVIIDANGLISFVTDRDIDQQLKIARLLEEGAQLKITIFCHHHVLSEFVYVLQTVYHCQHQKIHDMVSNFISMPGIVLTTDVDMTFVLAYWPSVIQDYGDAVIAAQCKIIKGSSIVTFDKKFKNNLQKLGLPIYEL